MEGTDRATFSFGFFEGGPTTTTTAADAAAAGPAGPAAAGADGREDDGSRPLPPPPPFAGAFAEARELLAAAPRDSGNAENDDFAASPIEVAPGVTLLKGTVAGEAAAAALIAGRSEPATGKACVANGEQGGEEGQQQRQRRRAKEGEDERERRRRLLADSDLVRGAYEGGFKLWEGALDLCARLAAKEKDGPSLLARIAEAAAAAEADEAAAAADGDGGGGGCPTAPPAASCCRRRVRVLELGCGHGLPGVLCLLAGADVDFQDYNAEVLERLTRPNVEANLARGAAFGAALAAVEGAGEAAAGATPASEEAAAAGAAAAAAPGRARYFAGDWRALPALLRRLAEGAHDARDGQGEGERGGGGGGEGRGGADKRAALPLSRAGRATGPAPSPPPPPPPPHYDLVLTAETLYRTDESGQPALLEALEATVGPPPGSAALVASKTHYFGVGGGTAHFRRLLLLARAAATTGADGGGGADGANGGSPILPPLAVDEAGSVVLQDGASNRREVLRLERR